MSFFLGGKKCDLSDGSKSRDGDDSKKLKNSMKVLIPCQMMFSLMVLVLQTVQKY